MATYWVQFSLTFNQFESNAVLPEYGPDLSFMGHD
jgi:hypothetical protein